MKKPKPADTLKAELDKMALDLLKNVSDEEKVATFKAVSTYYLGSTRWKKKEDDDDPSDTFGAMAARINNAEAIKQ